MNVFTDPYATLADYYDAMHATLTEDIGVVLSLAAAGAPILELGCGTGRLLVPLARAGHAITGVDRSLAMLSRANMRIRGERPAVAERIQLVCADMTHSTFAPGAFELAVIPYNTLMHLDMQAGIATCKSAAHQLAVGGQLFIDVVSPALVEQTTNDHQLTLERTFTDETSGDLVVVMAANELDMSRQQLEVTWLFDSAPAHGGSLRRAVVQIAYHYYFPHQLALMVEEAGLELMAMYGNYGQAPYSEDSERLLILARRAV